MSVQFLALQGNGGTAIPFYRQEAPVGTTVHSPQDAMRLKRYEEHWRFFNGIHWSFTREQGEPLVTANYSRAIVSKKASWLMGNGMVIDVPEAMRMKTKPTLDKVWAYNARDKLLLELATVGGVTGDVCVLLTYQAPEPVEKQLNPYVKGKVRIRHLMPNQCFPEWDPLNKERLLRLRVITEVPMYKPLPPDPKRPATMGGMGVLQKRRYVEDIYPDRIISGWEDSREKTVDNNELGEIPFVHISNESFPGEYWGKSDLDDLIDIQREFNEKLTDISDIVNYHAAPVTIITGAKAKQLEKGAKSLWSGLPADAKVFNLALGGDLAASYKYLEFVRQLMFDIANVPEGSLGRIQAISNTSGAALQMQFQPLIEATKRKQANYIEGLQKINYFILRIHQLMMQERYPIDLCKHCGGRIVSFKTADGSIKKKCYLIDPKTLQFMKPEDVLVTVTIEHSFGNEVRKMPFAQAKKMWGKKNPSYWDLEPMIDKEKEAEVHKANAERQKKDAKQEQRGVEEDAHQRQMELKHGLSGQDSAKKEGGVR